MLEEAQAVGQELPLVCCQHPDTTSLIKTAEDFEVYVKDGGCSLPCTTRLACGHICPRYLSNTWKVCTKFYQHLSGGVYDHLSGLCLQSLMQQHHFASRCA